MMIKGWKNNPQWVAHYKSKKEEALQRKIALWREELRMETISQDIQRRINRDMGYGVIKDD